MMSAPTAPNPDAGPSTAHDDQANRGFLTKLVDWTIGYRRDAPAPEDLADQITVLGIPNARFWADTQGTALMQEAQHALGREKAALGKRDSLPPAHFLATSGGSDDGAFGAGLICGWSDSGTMPNFKLVTGVSTGAMIAPFAFLGAPYMKGLREVFTEIAPSDVLTKHGIYKAIFGESLADTKPLWGLVTHYVNEKTLEDIAESYQKGRLLLIGTASLDAQRPVIWNIGAIAASGKPGALDLICKVILASASIPGAFPPVMIDVEAEGRHYQEMNVDGGVVVQSFLYPADIGMRVDFRSEQVRRQRHAYIIRNSRLDPEWASVNRRFLSISGRALATMIHYIGYSDILRIYAMANHDGVDYNLAYIGTDFPKVKHEKFDPAYMNALFDYAYKQTHQGFHWHKAPPVLDISGT